MTKTSNIYKVPIGDWSKDGHEYCEEYLIEANYPLKEMQEAYRKTCKKIGLQLSDGIDFFDEVYRIEKWRYMLCDYEESSIHPKAVKILVENGYEFSVSEEVLEEYIYFNGQDTFDLFMWFISFSLPDDFHYKELDIQSISGYWGDLNISVGYGVFE